MKPVLRGFSIDACCSGRTIVPINFSKAVIDGGIHQA